MAEACSSSSASPPSTEAPRDEEDAEDAPEYFNFFDLPVLVQLKVVDYLGPFGRSAVKRISSDLSRLAWWAELIRAKRCQNKGVTMPPKWLVYFAADRGLAVNFDLLEEFNPLGQSFDFYKQGWISFENLIMSTVPALMSSYGESECRRAVRGLRPMNIPRTASGFCASVKGELLLSNIGMSDWMMDIVRPSIHVHVRGILLDPAAEGSVRGKLVGPMDSRDMEEVENTLRDGEGEQRYTDGSRFFNVQFQSKEGDYDMGVRSVMVKVSFTGDCILEFIRVRISFPEDGPPAFSTELAMDDKFLLENYISFYL